MGWGLASVKNGSTRENGQRIRIGAFAERNLNSRLSAQLGIGFQYEGDALDFSKESTVSSQGFGLRSTVNTLDIKNLYEVYINAGVNWRKGRPYNFFPSTIGICIRSERETWCDTPKVHLKE